jgi:hypothetical protein
MWRTRSDARCAGMGIASAGHLERLEAQWIAELYCAEAPLAVRAAAFRSIVELRQCTARQVATFFEVDAAVVVRGLSLLQVPADSTAPETVEIHRCQPLPRVRAA